MGEIDRHLTKGAAERKRKDKMKFYIKKKNKIRLINEILILKYFKHL